MVPIDENWDAYVRFVAENGHPVIAELRVLPTLMDQPRDAWIIPTLEAGDQPPRGDWLQEPPEGGLTARTLRKGLHLGRASELAYEQIDTWLRQEQRMARPRPSKFTRDAIDVPRRPGSKGRDDLYYAVVASAYVHALEQGSAKPVVTAAQALSKHYRGTYEPAYVRDLLHVARQRGLLTRPPRGRAGGQLTEKAHAVLEREKKQ